MEEILTENAVKEVESKKSRNSSIELLRIILMFFIVLSHSYRYFTYADKSGLTKYFIMFTSVSNVMVNVFILISGYFLCKKNFSFKKLVLLLLEVSFYSIVSYFIAISCKTVDFSFKKLIIAIFATSFRSYWFVWAYCALYCLSPFINKLIAVLNRKQHLSLILIIFAIWFFIPFITTVSPDGYDVFVMIFFYLIGAYLRIYPDCFFNKGKNGLYALIVGYALFILSILCLTVLGKHISLLSSHPMYFTSKHSFVSVIFAIGLFVVFSKMNFYSKIVNIIAQSIFGVYVIHNNGYLREIIFCKIFKVNGLNGSLKNVLYVIGSSVIIFVACILIDLIRKYTLEKFTSYSYDKISNKIKNKTKNSKKEK